jgi:hypothetical protein
MDLFGKCEYMLNLQPDSSITEALRLLETSDLLLAVHDASFPCAEGEDTGRGTPYSSGGLALARFARYLGFTGLQLGPQGQTSSVNHSPYDGTLFSRNILSLDLKALVDNGLLSRPAWGKVDEYPMPTPWKSTEEHLKRYIALSYRCEETEIPPLWHWTGRSRVSGSLPAGCGTMPCTRP